MNALSEPTSFAHDPADPLPALRRRMLAGEAISLAGRGQELIWDLACLDPLWIETRLAGCALAQWVELHAVHIERGLAIGRAAAFDVYCFPAQWTAMRARLVGAGEDPSGIEIDTGDSGVGLSLSVDARAHRFALQMLLRAYQVGQAGVVPFPRRLDAVPTMSDSIQRLAGSEPAARDVDPGDIAEVCGALSLSPERMQKRGRAHLATAELVPCLFEAVADQALGVRVLAGTSGLAQRYNGEMHSYRDYRDGWIGLVSERCNIRLELAAVDSVWVLERPGQDGSRHQLRVYDEEGRALLLMEDLPVERQPESPIWRTLARALVD